MVKISATTLLLLFGGAVISVAAQRCGPQAGNAICAAGNCCSQYGWLVIPPASILAACMIPTVFHCLQ